MLFCTSCNIEISSNSHYRTRLHKENCSEEIESGIKLVRTAFKERIVTYHISTNKHATDVKKFLESIREKTLILISNLLKQHPRIKVNMELYGEYLLASTKDQSIKSFNTKYEFLDQNTNLETFFSIYQDILLKKTSQFSEMGSGWALSKLLFLELNINRFKKVGGINI